MLKVSTKSLYKLHVDGLDGNQSKKYIDNPGAFIFIKTGMSYLSTFLSFCFILKTQARISENTDTFIFT